MIFRSFLLGTAAAAALAVPAYAQDGSVEQRLDRMEKRIEAQDAQIQAQQAEIRALKHGRRGAAMSSETSAEAEAAPPPPAQPEVTAAEFEALQNQVY